MALFENLIKDAGKGEKKAAGFAVTMVHYTKLIPSENNNYSMAVSYTHLTLPTKA